MAACFPAPIRSSRLAGMASIAVNRSRRQGPRLFEGPVLFRRRRMRISELVALAWLLVKFARLARSYSEAPGRGRERTRAREGI